MMTAVLSVIILIAGYLIGSNMTAVRIAKSKSKDIRSYGSGNAGSTNVLRAFGWKWGLICFAADSAKGAASVGLGMLAGYLAPMVFPNAVFIYKLHIFLGCVGLLGAILGHLLPVFYDFRGGKSVAVAAGGFLVLAPVQLLIALAVALLIILITRMVSLGSLIGTLLVALLVIIRNTDSLPMITVSILVAVIIVIAHLPNIQRIIEGRERKLEQTEWETKDDEPDTKE